jgi:hypothetical protein
MKDVRLVYEGVGILEKSTSEGTFKRLILGAVLVASSEDENDYITVDMGDYGYDYLVDSEDVTISPDGTIEFEAHDAKYVIRKVAEDDNLTSLNPEPEDSEEA